VIDIKYHIASLVAVFLALGIGLLMGTTLLGNDTLIDYQKQVTNRLETQLENLRQKNESVETMANELEMDLNIQTEFNNKVLPVLVHNKLENINLAVIETNGYRFSSTLIDTLELAEANITSITSFMHYSEDQLPGDLTQSLGWADNNTEYENLSSFVAAKIADAIITGEMENVDLLAQANIIQVSGTYGESLDGIILVGGSQDEDTARKESLDLPLLDTFKSHELAIYGVEETSAGYSYMEFYQKQRLTATVDNIDTVPGQLALVLSIDGQPGHYGVKSTAQRLLPELKTSQGGDGGA